MADKTKIPIAEQIVRRIVESSIRLQWTRHWDAIEAGEITEEEMVQDALNLALGDDTGCLDEEEINSDNIDLLYVQEAFSSLAHQLSQEKELGESLNALMELACADIIFFHSQDSGPFVGPETPELPKHVAFSVLVNDLFVPAADAEGFDISEAVVLRDVFRKGGYEGVVRWVQNKRDNMPLRPHVEKRISDREDLRAENARLTEALRVKEEEWQAERDANAVVFSGVTQELRKHCEGYKAECERLGKAAQTLVDTMETCHICKGTVLVEENPVHCEDCPFDCDNHDEPECASLYDLHLAVKQALAARRTQEREER